ncbi:hypothetical protein Patl1_14463 [Pistacia atlantica]|uniref:Uncharacterized protein n=1 Tax=Pistacia atlantica TaxID=434234 RepID=A0ACC1AWU7_9ROSI|nr:hypothetical protein Patl1_14463 [Pistacia atlantica]
MIDYVPFDPSKGEPFLRSWNDWSVCFLSLCGVGRLEVFSIFLVSGTTSLFALSLWGWEVGDGSFLACGKNMRPWRTVVMLIILLGWAGFLHEDAVAGFSCCRSA